MFDGYEDAYPYGAGYEADGYANPLNRTQHPYHGGGGPGYRPTYVTPTAYSAARARQAAAEAQWRARCEADLRARAEARSRREAAQRQRAEAQRRQQEQARQQQRTRAQQYQRREPHPADFFGQLFGLGAPHEPEPYEPPARRPAARGAREPAGVLDDIIGIGEDLAELPAAIFGGMFGLDEPRRAPRSQPAQTPSGSRPRAAASSTPPREAGTPRTGLFKPTSTYTQVEVDAATTMQTTWRARAARRAAWKQLDAISADLRRLRRAFVPPPALDFLVGGQPVSVRTAGVPLPPRVPSTSDVAGDEDAGAAAAPVPRLAFTPASTPALAHDEALARILDRLDAVPSGGDKRVRARRRALARVAEAEAARAERWRVDVWRAYLACERVASAPVPGASACDGPQAQAQALPHPLAHPRDVAPVVVLARPEDAASPSTARGATDPFADPPIRVDDVNEPAPIADVIAASPTLPLPTMSAPLPAALARDPLLANPELLMADLSEGGAPAVPEALTSAAPLSNVLGSQHDRDLSALVPADVQDAADDASHVADGRVVHSGFAANIENIPRMDAQILERVGAQDGEHDAGALQDAGQETAGDSRDVHGGTGTGAQVVPPAPAPLASSDDENDFVLV